MVQTDTGEWRLLMYSPQITLSDPIDLPPQPGISGGIIRYRTRKGAHFCCSGVAVRPLHPRHPFDFWQSIVCDFLLPRILVK